jgi:hypothetical protein
MADLVQVHAGPAHRFADIAGDDIAGHQIAERPFHHIAVERLPPADNIPG